jgi:hypothetical protein
VSRFDDAMTAVEVVRKSSRQRRGGRGSSVGLLMLFLVLILLPFALAFTPPWTTGFTSVPSASSSGSGTNTIGVAPSANTVNGVMLADTTSATSSTGSASITTETGFWGPSGAFVNPHNYNVYYNFTITWSVSLSTSACAFGHSSASASIVLYGNVYDSTSGTWVLSTAASTTVTSHSITCGTAPWGGSATMASYQVKFAASFQASVTYQYYSYVLVTTSATGAGLAGGSSANANIGTGSNYAQLASCAMY